MDIDKQKLNSHDILFHQNLIESKKFFQKLFDNNICTCQQYNRNSNAFHNDNEEPQQQQQQHLYPHMRKLYNHDTNLLEYVYIIMSTIKPNDSINKQQQQQQQDETLGQQQQQQQQQQHRRRQTRISKQRAKVLITEYCRDK
ncbi:unnamed protein product [Rotaria sordida]|uniref:Uncharacterized protein n=1 Tax=Rotaria sordida TaxID=392033 RepID=A0A819PKG5_9BILA|nr:unnamed protein product [Rotaria sordida]CAF1316448.1 unnamed protein product [Rotaria sordida]CAF3843312.1 unnamed protein product [Rotaria sordida]CAF4018711.1 unnamed protein product [Rotaria sordida]